MTVAPGTLRATDSATTYNGLYSSPPADLDKCRSETGTMADLMKYQQSLLLVKPDAMSKLEEIVTKVRFLRRISTHTNFCLNVRADTVKLRVLSISFIRQTAVSQHIGSTMFY